MEDKKIFLLLIGIVILLVIFSYRDSLTGNLLRPDDPDPPYFPPYGQIPNCLYPIDDVDGPFDCNQRMCGGGGSCVDTNNDGCYDSCVAFYRFDQNIAIY